MFANFCKTNLSISETESSIHYSIHFFIRLLIDTPHALVELLSVVPLLAPAADQDVVGLALRPRDRLEADARERRRRVRRAPKEANKLFNVENEYFDDSFLQFHAISEIRIKFLEMFINVAHH